MVDSPQNIDAYLTVTQAANLKGVARSAIYDAIARKRLPTRRLFGRIAIARQDILGLRMVRGRPAGPLSPRHKARISRSLKRSWRERKPPKETIF